MAERDVVKVIGACAEYYGEPLSDDRLRIYARLLADLDPEMLKQAAYAHMAESQWFPKASELRRRAVELLLTAQGVPTAYEAWEEVSREFSRAGRWGRPQFSHPTVARAVELIGGWMFLCNSENIVADRARFVDAFDRQVERLRTNMQMLPQTQDTVSQLRAQIDADRIEAGKQQLYRLMTGNGQGGNHE